MISEKVQRFPKSFQNKNEPNRSSSEVRRCGDQISGSPAFGGGTWEKVRRSLKSSKANYNIFNIIQFGDSQNSEMDFQKNP